MAIHLHHVDLSQESIRQEIVTRLGQSAYVPAISNDIARAARNPALYYGAPSDSVEFWSPAGVVFPPYDRSRVTPKSP